MRHLIEFEGERQVVRAGDLEGDAYPGHVVVERDVSDPPAWANGEVKLEREGGKWKTDRTKAENERRGKARSMSREELVQRLEDLEARVAKLEAGKNA